MAVIFPENTDAPRHQVASGINVRPHDYFLFFPVLQCRKRLLHLHAPLLRRRRHRMLHHQDIRLRKVNLVSDTTVIFVHLFIADRKILMTQSVDRRAAAVYDTVGLLPHLYQSLPALLRGRKMIVGQLCDRVSHQLVNISRDLSSLNMRKRNVQVGCGNRRGHRLISVSDSHHHIRPDVLKNCGQFYNTQSRGFRLRFQILAFYHIINLSGGSKSVLFYDAQRVPEAVQQNGRPHNKLQFQIRVLLYRL